MNESEGERVPLVPHKNASKRFLFPLLGVFLFAVAIVGSLCLVFFELSARISQLQVNINTQLDGLRINEEKITENLNGLQTQVENTTQVLNGTLNSIQAQVDNTTQALNETLNFIQTQVEDTTQALNETLNSIQAQVDNTTKVLNGTLNSLQAQVENTTQVLNGTLNSIQAQVEEVASLANPNKPPCVLQCIHGGYPSSDCTLCISCDSGWTGVSCNVPSSCSSSCQNESCICANGGILDTDTCTCVCLNGTYGLTCSEVDTNITISDAIQVLSSLANSAMKKGTTFQVAPSSIGKGFDKTTDQIGLPCLSFQVTQNSSSILVNNSITFIPDGTHYEQTLDGVVWPSHQTFVFEHFWEYLYRLFSWTDDGELGMVMYPGTTIESINSEFFSSPTTFITQTQAFYSTYETELTKDISSYSLDEHFVRALEYLNTQPFNERTKPFFYYFFQAWGTNFISATTEGGLLNYMCTVPQAIWNWNGLGRVTQAYVQEMAEFSFTAQMIGSTVSTVFSKQATCQFICAGGSIEVCPTSGTAQNSVWPSTIATQPITTSVESKTITSLISDITLRTKIELALISYFADQSAQWQQYASLCDTCLPTLSSFVLAYRVPFTQETVIKAGTCSTAIRVAAAGSCSMIMWNNAAPINGGNGQCMFTDIALFGSAAVYSESYPSTEWLVFDVNVDNAFKAVSCSYPGIQCNYVTGWYNLYCL